MSLLPGRVDVHQHLWPAALIDALRTRSEPPFLDGWTLHLAGEAPYPVNPAHHDVATRAAAESGADQVLLSLSAGLGIHDLKPEDAAPLLTAWHDGVAELPAPFGAWAATTYADPDLGLLARRLAGGAFVGLEVSANWLATPTLLQRLLPTLEVCQAADRPVLVHPGPVTGEHGGTEQAWWAPVVNYTAQLQSAWWAWAAVGRRLLPELRICFVACAGLAPAHQERYLARGGVPLAVDPDAFVDSSSYGPQGLDAVIRALGVDVIVYGSDRPYAEPVELAGSYAGASVRHAINIANPRRLLVGGSP
ncbi:predicted TIM-barrel fold metal-dependent hydrolase [Jatrophihabitans sp. GAS493]|uniref:amidohydrolase family protein n=1 Tax=Jatrophihabitans sp. GAS493 TaxID=1907575 RepID=UPI000BBFCCF5|nr:amidohydrolase family protein [Jatrophihabitans sp. GAS493]SOD71526.1 predicted TIM-barrel fold metal-dependent hydrolase [Jatrophihabitans sp. GAS493]